MSHQHLSPNNRDYFEFAGAELARHIHNKFKDKVLAILDNVVEAMRQLPNRDQYAAARQFYVEAYCATRDSYSR